MRKRMVKNSPKVKRTKLTKLVIRPYLYLIPLFTFLIAFTYYPIARMFYLSLFQWGIGSKKVFIGIENYITVSKTPLFWQVVKNNIVFSFGSVFISVSLALFLAVLANKNLKFKGFYQSMVFYPHIIPLAVGALIWIWLFNPRQGLFNYLLGAEVNWLNSYELALPSLMMVQIWANMGYYFLLFLAGLQNLPPNLYEVAELEGANSWQKFRYLTFPLISSTTFFVVLLAIIHSIQSVDLVYLMTEGGPANSSNLIIYYLYTEAFRWWHLDIASTISSILFIVLLLLTALYFILLERKVYYA
jgi:ABC-type sugar transport system permease subunit